jgi:uncharacterized RDD family membrane protein YckC
MQYDYAGLGWRFLAALIDGVVLAIPNLLIVFLLGGATTTGLELEGPPAVVAMSAMMAIGLGYFIGMETARGATLGKMALGLRVVMANGAHVDVRASAVRNVLRIVDGLCCYLVGAILVLQSPRGQRLGDRIAGTVVVRRVATSQ